MYQSHAEYEPVGSEGRARDLAPFRFEDLPVIDGRRIEPESWGPKYSKPPIPGRKVSVDRWPTNAPSGQKTAHVDDAKLRAKIRAEFQAAANADRLAWALGERRDCGWKLTESIHEAYAKAMAEKRAREAAQAA